MRRGAETDRLRRRGPRISMNLRDLSARCELGEIGTITSEAGGVNAATAGYGNGWRKTSAMPLPIMSSGNSKSALILGS